MPRLRADVTCDPDQSHNPVNLLSCPKCGQKIVDVRQLQGIAEIRVKCRRCGTFVKAEIVGFT